MNASELLTFASNARKQAEEYREAASTANEYWRDRWLKHAEEREEHADFYERKARYHQ